MKNQQLCLVLISAPSIKNTLRDIRRYSRNMGRGSSTAPENVLYGRVPSRSGDATFDQGMAFLDAKQRMTPQQRDILKSCWPENCQVTAGFVESTWSSETEPDLIVISDVPGATPAQVTASGRIGRYDQPMPAETFAVDRDELGKDPAPANDIDIPVDMLT